MDEMTLIRELRLSLPSSRILQIVRAGAVEIYGEYIYLKQREGQDTNEFLKYGVNKGPYDDYAELEGKNVIFSLSMFGRRGQDAVKKYIGSGL